MQKYPIIWSDIPIELDMKFHTKYPISLSDITAVIKP